MTAERIVYSAATAHLFERATAAGMIAGSTALKPAAVEAWQTFNFKIGDLHTYVAGGVRVHNDSGFLGRIGNAIDTGLHKLLGGKDCNLRGKLTDLTTAPFQAAGDCFLGDSWGGNAEVGSKVGRATTEAVSASEDPMRMRMMMAAVSRLGWMADSQSERWARLRPVLGEPSVRWAPKSAACPKLWKCGDTLK